MEIRGAINRVTDPHEGGRYGRLKHLIKNLKEKMVCVWHSHVLN